MKHSKRKLRGIISDAMGVNADNKLIWAPSVPVVYIDNPKCGSTTIKNTLKRAQAAAYERAGRKYKRHEDPHKADDCLKSRGLPRKDTLERYLISCVRNPFTRALSGYLDKVATRDPSFFPELRNRRVDTFEQHMLAIADYRPKNLNFHFRPQHINLDFPNLPYDAIFFLERIAVFSDFFAEVVPDLELETSAPHSRGARNRSKLLEHYTDRAVALVQEVYAKDFELFGYSTDLEQTDVVPGECIMGGHILPIGTKLTASLVERPLNATTNKPAYEATLRYHQLVYMLTL